MRVDLDRFAVQPLDLVRAGEEERDLVSAEPREHTYEWSHNLEGNEDDVDLGVDRSSLVTGGIEAELCGSATIIYLDLR